MTLTLLDYRRQEAIDTVIRMMGCTHERSAHCEHVDAVERLAAAIAETTFRDIDHQTLHALTEAGFSFGGVETHIKPGVSGPRT